MWARGAESPALPFQAGLLPFPVVSRTGELLHRPIDSPQTRFPGWATPDQLHAIVAGVCGNSVCEVGELVTASEDYCPGDCPDVSDHISCPVPSHAPSSTETTAVGDPERQCNGRGTCIPLARSCDCFVGYAGAECTSCAEGFVPISNTQHRGALPNIMLSPKHCDAEWDFSETQTLPIECRAMCQ